MNKLRNASVLLCVLRKLLDRTHCQMVARRKIHRDGVIDLVWLSHSVDAEQQDVVLL